MIRARFSKEQIAFLLHVVKSYSATDDGLTEWERKTVVEDLGKRLRGLTYGAKFHTDRFAKQVLKKWCQKYV